MKTKPGWMYTNCKVTVPLGKMGKWKGRKASTESIMFI